MGFHPAWFCPLGTGGWEGLLNRQNPLGAAKVICRRSLMEKIAQTLIEIKNKYEFQRAAWSDCKHHQDN